MSKSIAITSGKGGAGKTSLAINLALRLNDSKEKLYSWMLILGWLTVISYLNLAPLWT